MLTRTKLPESLFDKYSTLVRKENYFVVKEMIIALKSERHCGSCMRRICRDTERLLECC